MYALNLRNNENAQAFVFADSMIDEDKIALFANGLNCYSLSNR